MTIDPGDLREGFKHSLQHNAEVDEPELAAVPTWPHARGPFLLRDDPSTDTIVDVMTEEQLLRGMEKLVPMESSIGSGGGGSDTGTQGGSPNAVPKKALGDGRHRFGLK